MNSRGQAALEYLMTYGWALVIIVVVAGVLFLIAMTPSGGVVCNSSDPAKFPIARYNIASGASPNEIVVQNGTGGSITLTDVNGFVPNTFSDLNGAVSEQDGASVYGGATITLTGVCTSGSCDLGEGYSGQAILTYTDQFGYENKTVTITCQGTVP